MKRLFLGLFLAVLILPAAAQSVPRVKEHSPVLTG